MRGFIIAVIALLLVTPAHARHRAVQAPGPTWTGFWSYPVAAPRGTVIVHRHRFARDHRHSYRLARHTHRDPGMTHPAPFQTAANGLVAPLAAKVAEITSTCGSHVISAVRHTFIAGTRHISLHASGKAADVTGNPSCIYAELRGWPGGYSVDYGRMRHVHISYDNLTFREWGARFRHGGGHRRNAKKIRKRRLG